MKPKRLPQDIFDKIYSKVPRLTVEAIIVNGSKVVLTKRSIPPFKGMWHIPGGTVFFGEKLVNTVKRVAKEETGLEVSVERMIDIIDYGKWARPKPPFHTVGVAFLCKPISGKLRGSKQGKKIRYFKAAPKNIIKIQEEFLKKNELLI